MSAPKQEDELVWEYFGRKDSGFFVDVGANDPKTYSQTWLLESKGWKGLLVEPLGRLADKLRAARPASRVFQVACGGPGHAETAEFHEAEADGHSSLAPNLVDPGIRYVRMETVPVLTMDELLAEAGSPEIDFISIDVEGTQFDVLRGFTLQKHRPKLLFVEDHLTDWKTHFLIRSQGYRLVKRTGNNNWYVPEGTPGPATTFGERLKLWRKVWPGTPMRRLKAVWDRFRTARRPA